MFKGGQGAGLLLKALPRFALLARLIIGEHLLDDAKPIESLGVLRQIDGPHTPLAEGAHHAILPGVHRLSWPERIVCGSW